MIQQSVRSDFLKLDQNSTGYVYNPEIFRLLKIESLDFRDKILSGKSRLLTNGSSRDFEYIDSESTHLYPNN